MEEIWKDVVGYEGLYQVSNLGNIRSVDRVVEYKDGRKDISKASQLSRKQLQQAIISLFVYTRISKGNIRLSID